MKTDISGKSNGLSGLYWHFKKRCCSILMYFEKERQEVVIAHQKWQAMQVQTA
jgi:hypothetical protein